MANFVLQITSFREQMNGMKHQIEALGYFSISRRLFPSVIYLKARLKIIENQNLFRSRYFNIDELITFLQKMIGTTLTYFLIMVQFHSAEKS